MTKIGIKTICPICKKEQVIEVDEDKYNLYMTDRTLRIQDVFPDLSADEREALISGICAECWDKME